jgi:hypothetical protein
MKRMIRFLFMGCLFSMVQLHAAPLVTSVTLGNNVSNTHVVAVATPNLRPPFYYPGSTLSSVFVLPNQTFGDMTTAPPPDYSPGPTYSSASSPMLGGPSGYGALLMQFMVSAGDLSLIGNNLPTNANDTVLSGASGPINTTNLSLSAAGVAAGTTVTMTVDMQGELPHLIAVMSGSYPVISFDASGTGLLTIRGTTTGAFTNKAGESLDSSFGFIVATDNIVATAPSPLALVVQTEAWIGDMFPLLPGLDGNAAISGGGGTLSSSTARAGLTLAGPCGETRSANLFIAASSLPALYGTGVTAANLAAFINDSGQMAVVGSNAATFNTIDGSKVALSYSFSTDPVDISVGVSGSSVGSAPSACLGPGIRVNTNGGGVLGLPDVMLLLLGGMLLFLRRVVY